MVAEGFGGGRDEQAELGGFLGRGRSSVRPRMRVMTLTHLSEPIEYTTQGVNPSVKHEL